MFNNPSKNNKNHQKKNIKSQKHQKPVKKTYKKTIKKPSKNPSFLWFFSLSDAKRSEIITRLLSEGRSEGPEGGPKASSMAETRLPGGGVSRCCWWWCSTVGKTWKKKKSEKRTWSIWSTTVWSCEFCRFFENLGVTSNTRLCFSEKFVVLYGKSSYHMALSWQPEKKTLTSSYIAFQWCWRFKQPFIRFLLSNFITNHDKPIINRIWDRQSHQCFFFRTSDLIDKAVSSQSLRGSLGGSLGCSPRRLSLCRSRLQRFRMWRVRMPKWKKPNGMKQDVIHLSYHIILTITIKYRWCCALMFFFKLKKKTGTYRIMDEFVDPQWLVSPWHSGPKVVSANCHHCFHHSFSV